MEKKFQLKLYPSPLDNRDYKIKLTSQPKPIAPDAIVDLSTYCTSVKDQGSLGSCTAFATIAAMEYLQKKYGQVTTDDIFSERFTYYVTRVNILNWTPDDSGAYVRDAIKSVAKFGTCLEKSFEYSTDYQQEPPQLAYSEASKYQALSYAKFEDGASPAERQTLISALKANLNAGFPIITGFACFSNIWTAENGVLPLPNNQIIGGHSVLLVGYNEAKQLFKFKNSWSSAWGDNGYGYLPYEYYLSGNMFDSWAIYTAEDNERKNVGLEIINPSKTKTMLQNQVCEVLTTIIADIANYSDKNKCISLLTALAVKYKTQPKIVNMINSLKLPFLHIS